MNSAKFRVEPGEKARLYKWDALSRLRYPKVNEAEHRQLEEAKGILLAE